MSVNKVILIGNLGADPEVRYTQSGDAVANLRIATSERFKDRQTGERKEATEWHRVIFFRRQAEVAGQYLQKGSQVYIEGRIKTRKYHDKQTGADRYSTEVVGSQLKMLGARNGGNSQGGQGGYAQQQPAQQQAPAQQQQYQQPPQQQQPPVQQPQQPPQQQPPQQQPPVPAQGGDDGFFDDDDIPF